MPDFNVGHISSMVFEGSSENGPDANDRCKIIVISNLSCLLNKKSAKSAKVHGSMSLTCINSTLSINQALSLDLMTVKVGFHYPSSRPVNSGSGNRPLKTNDVQTKRQATQER